MKETQKRKVDEEKERYSNETLRTSLLETQEKSGRTSFALAPTASASAAAFPRTPSLRESLSGVDRPILDYNESFVGDAAVTMAAIKR